MEFDEKSLRKCVKALIDLALEGEMLAHTYEEFCAREPRLKSISREAFCAEYGPARLALGCAYWVGCCANHRIEDKALNNLFFKEVMSLFESPKSLEVATRFSESLYASNADLEQSPVLGVLVHLFSKLGLEATVKAGEGDEGKLSAGFHFMMEVSEALKVAFEKQFDDFYYAHQDVVRKEGAL